MIKLIEDESTILKYQKKLLRCFKPWMDEKIPARIGHMGASFNAKVLWSNRLGIWVYSTKIDGSRYWNAFGLDKPKAQSAVSIACEINLPVAGMDRRIGGALAKDKKNNVYLVHRGIIGGGRKGVGKTLFASAFRGVWTQMDDGDQDSDVAIIGLLNSPQLVRQVLHFVQKIDRLKDQTAPPSLQLEIFSDYNLREELIGARLSESTRNLETECNKALVIKDLSDGLAGHRLRAANDARRDLFIVDRNGKIKTIFLVKADASPDTLHQGAMQLVMNSLSLPEQPRLIMVMPDHPGKDWEEKLKKLNIAFLTYRWKGDRVEFPELDQLSFF